MDNFSLTLLESNLLNSFVYSLYGISYDLCNIDNSSDVSLNLIKLSNLSPY